MNGKRFIAAFAVGSLAILGALGYQVWKVDPYFHYHAPDTQNHNYVLNSERYQNNGIAKHFAYDAMITGTSMTANFKATQFDRLFGVNSVKTTFLGAGYRELREHQQAALAANPNLRVILRGLDMPGALSDPYDLVWYEGQLPTYLYDKNPLNDVNYLLNRDVLFDRVLDNHGSGITDFDSYSYWQPYWTFGIHSVCPNGVHVSPTAQTVSLSETQIKTLTDNLEINVLQLARDYPQTQFYLFIPPYGMCWWANEYSTGTIGMWMEVQYRIAQTLLPQENIHLFSFFNQFDLITDQNNYKDITHYAAWINDWMLGQIAQGAGEVTWENLEENLRAQYDFFTTFDYNSLNDQQDYEDDFLAAAQWATEE